MSMRFFLSTLLSLAVAVTLFLGTRCAKIAWKNSKCQVESTADIDGWTIIKRGENEYLTRATFSYLVDGERIEGQWTFPTSYLNPGAARLSIKENANKQIPCWYNPYKPSEHNLQKKFPYNDFFRFIVSLIVSVYLVFKLIFLKTKLY